MIELFLSIHYYYSARYGGETFKKCSAACKRLFMMFVHSTSVIFQPYSNPGDIAGKSISNWTKNTFEQAGADVCVYLWG